MIPPKCPYCKLVYIGNHHDIDKCYDAPTSVDNTCCVNCEEIVIYNNSKRTCSCLKCGRRECKSCLKHCYRGEIRDGYIDEKGVLIKS